MEIVSDNQYEPPQYKCEKCDKIFKRKSSLTRHKNQNMNQKLLKLKLKNQNLLIKVNMYMEQIQFFKELIIIRETLRHSAIPSNEIISSTQAPAIKE